MDRNNKQNFGIFFCVGLSDNPIWINGLVATVAMLCRIELVKCNKQLEKIFKS